MYEPLEFVLAVGMYSLLIHVNALTIIRSSWASPRFGAEENIQSGSTNQNVKYFNSLLLHLN